MKIRIHFDHLNDLLLKIVEVKKDFDIFCKKIDKVKKELDNMESNISAIAVIIILGDDFI